MKDNVLASKILGNDYRLTRTAHGVWIEVLDYHAQPLLLSRDDLDDLGLTLRRTLKKRATPQRRSRAKRSEA